MGGQSFVALRSMARTETWPSQMPKNALSAAAMPIKFSSICKFDKLESRD
jgi:hypothetical protein